jgi:hypothetical protein
MNGLMMYATASGNLHHRVCLQYLGIMCPRNSQAVGLVFMCVYARVCYGMWVWWFCCCRVRVQITCARIMKVANPSL